MAKDRPPSFQFYPRDLLSSRAVSLMTPEARGGYLLLLCHAWLSDEPGVLSDDDESLSVLSGLAERWPACRIAIARAFVQRPGHWIQERMIDERKYQENRYKQAKKGARITNAARWGSVAQRHDSDSLSVRTASRTAVTPASVVEVPNLDSKDLPSTLEIENPHAPPEVEQTPPPSPERIAFLDNRLAELRAQAAQLQATGEDLLTT